MPFEKQSRTKSSGASSLAIHHNYMPNIADTFENSATKAQKLWQNTFEIRSK